MAKSKRGFGTYSNDGFGNFNPEISDDEIEKLKLKIQKNKGLIRDEFTEIVNRIDFYLKKNFGAIPNTEDFVKWYFDNQKIKNLGRNRLNVTEKDIYLKCEEYVKYLDTIKNGLLAKNLKLNYGIGNNDKIINHLYDKLYPNKIDVTLDEFKQHFDENYNGNQIKWKGTETEFVNLFTSLKFENQDLFKILSIHFLNNKNNKFIANQLSVSKSKSSFTINYKGKDFIEEIVSEINNIKS